jgi:hypothetical protein
MAGTKIEAAEAPDNPLAELAYFATEAALPGSSQILKGDIAGGMKYGLAGLAAMVVVGPIGRLAVGAASYMKSTSGRDVPAALLTPRS